MHHQRFVTHQFTQSIDNNIRYPSTLTSNHLFYTQAVRVFKFGPDYLDPQILERGSKAPVTQLDLFMAGEAWCKQQIYRAVTESKLDIVLVEGAMGLYDGDESSADLAARFNIPVVLILDVRAMAQTAAAIAVGWH
jgi:cobyrinic acid a,c-diamide synthase